MITASAKFAGTKIYDVLTAVDTLYKNIEEMQKEWKERSPARCPDGCGSCCVHFEPEIYEYEALYLAAWMLEYQPERAERICTQGWGSAADNDGCVLFDSVNPYHCTVYGGRCLICRLFGYSGDHGKDLTIRWKPCKYMHLAADAAIQKGRQYSGEEMQALFGAVPPGMSSASAQLLSFNPDDTHPQPLRTALPAALEKLKMILRFLTPPEPDCPSPHPLSA
ncbi:MAG: YkgJ family cysteine cluster protein [Treponema sp.]